MLTIRRHQFEAFAAAARGAFEARMLAHLARCWPARVAAMTEPRVAMLIRAAVVRAREHGLTQEFDVGRFIDCCFVLGPDFEADPRCPWAAPILGSGRSARERADQLWSRTRKFLVAGRDSKDR